MCYNYKGIFSIVLLAMVDYDYKFLTVDVGCQVKISDDGVFRNSYLYPAFNNEVSLPKPRALPTTTE